MARPDGSDKRPLMISFSFRKLLAHPKVRAIATLSVLALLGNMVSVPLSFGVDIVFGSIPVLIAVALLGTRAAVLVAFVGALYTVFLWNHPWAIGVFVLEALVVGMLCRGGQRNLVLADLTFWILAAGPIFFLYYRNLLGLDLVTTTLVALKTALNGIFNALIAGLLLLGCNLLSRDRRRRGLAGADMSNLLFHSLLTAILLAGATPIVYEGHMHRHQLESALAERLHGQAISLIRGLTNAIPITQTGQATELTNMQLSPDMGVALVAQDGHVMASQGVVASVGTRGETISLEHGMFLWIPPGDVPNIVRRIQGRYALSVPLGEDAAGRKLLIEDTAAPLVHELERHRLTLFYFLAVMALFGILIARLLAGSLSRPLRALEAASRNLTQQIAAGEEPKFPHSAINEYESLSRTLREMATRLSDSFNALQAHKAGLEAQVELRTLELNRFKSTLDRALDCVFMFDAETLQFFYVNEGAVKQVGFTRDELMTMHPYDVKPHMPEAKFREMITALVAGEEKSLTFETIHQHKSGSTLPVEIFLQYIAPVGEQARFVSIVRDITERKRVERMKSEFVATVSHELRTPLTSITGSLGLIMGGAPGKLSKQATELISIAHKNSQRLTYLINDLLDMEKLDVGKLQFDMRPQSLYPLIQQSVDTHRPYGMPRNVTIELRSDIAGTQACVDGQRLMQAMSNLLANAIKFSPHGGVVEVEVTRDDANVRVKVTDHGPGVPAEFRAHIFEKFAQADASDTRLRGGTGLGLAITREIVTRMGGRIDFASEEGQGACFYFELPQWRAQAKAPHLSIGLTAPVTLAEDKA